MNKRERAEQSQRRLYINIIIVVLFSVLMVTLIVRLNKSEPDTHLKFMNLLAQQFQRSVTNSHWQWQAEGRPEMIMLVHYNDQYMEIDRRPVRMAHFGWPRVEPMSEGCGKLWQMVMNLPQNVDGFRIIPEYYRGELVNGEPVNSRCRFRLSTGPYFDYSIYSGVVDDSGLK